MATCILNAGVTLDCRDGQGGIFEILLTTYSAGTTYTTISGVITGSTGYNTYYKFEFPSETSDVVETGNFSKENQTAFYEQVINSIIFKTDQATRDALAVLGMGRLVAIVKTNQSEYFMYGKTAGLWLSTASLASGKAYGDLNGITYSLTGREPNSATQVASAFVKTLGF